MDTPKFTDEARSAFILLIEEYAAKHVDPPGFDEGQEAWEQLKLNPAALDRQIAGVMEGVFDTVYDDMDTAKWRSDSEEYWQKRFSK